MLEAALRLAQALTEARAGAAPAVTGKVAATPSFRYEQLAVGNAIRKTCHALPHGDGLPLGPQVQGPPGTLIVPYPAGGGTDFFARLIGQKMSELVGQPIVVENKPGAATNLGADFVAKAPPDGYTVLLGDVATYAANPSLYKKLPFDPAKDFAPVTLTARFLSVLVANPNKLKVNSVAELIDQAKREPGKIDIAHAGVGNPFHLAAVLFQQAAGIKLNEVPYRGAGPAVQGLLGGDVHMMFVDYATARSHLAADTLRALGVDALDDVPEARLHEAQRGLIPAWIEPHEPGIAVELEGADGAAGGRERNAVETFCPSRSTRGSIANSDWSERMVPASAHRRVTRRDSLSPKQEPRQAHSPPTCSDRPPCRMSAAYRGSPRVRTERQSLAATPK